MDFEADQLLPTLYSSTSLQRTPMGPSRLFCIESCPYFRGRFLHSSMWLGLQTVSSLERCPLFRVSFPGTSNGNSYVSLVTGDYFPHWMEAYTIPNQEPCCAYGTVNDINALCTLGYVHAWGSGLHACGLGDYVRAKAFLNVCNIILVQRLIAMRRTYSWITCSGSLDPLLMDQYDTLRISNHCSSLAKVV